MIMILNLTDGIEAVFLALILQSVEADKPISEMLELYMDKEQIPEFLEGVRKFASSKLKHPVLKTVLDEPEERIHEYHEKKTFYKQS
ncbi:MAG: hypothetical protein HY351_05720 [Candidatus Omnitrophica bacterium]|nr:hypothetical protein [Candidatus Omnitrophota bacterium]